jgi:hypothetical protein
MTFNENLAYFNLDFRYDLFSYWGFRIFSLRNFGILRFIIFVYGVLSFAVLEQ